MPTIVAPSRRDDKETGQAFVVRPVNKPPADQWQTGAWRVDQPV